MIQYECCVIHQNVAYNRLQYTWITCTMEVRWGAILPLGGTPGPPSVVRLGCPSPDRELFGPTATTGSMEIHIPESESTKIDQKKSYLVLSCLINSHRTKDIFTSNVNIPEGRHLSDPEYRVLADPIIIVLFVYLFVLFVCVCGGGQCFFCTFQICGHQVINIWSRARWKPEVISTPSNPASNPTSTHFR